MQSNIQIKSNFFQRNWWLMCILAVVLTAIVCSYIFKNAPNENNGTDITNASSAPADSGKPTGSPPDSLRH